MNILMINQPLNNRGDESAHKALVKALLQHIPNVQITVMFMEANDNSIEQFKVHDDRIDYINLKPSFGFYKWTRLTMMKGTCSLLWQLHPSSRHIMNLYRKYDLVLCAPGGICMGGFQDWHHLTLLKMAQVTGRKLIYYGRSFGPFNTNTAKERRFKKFSLEMLNYFDFLSIRDKKSQLLAEELNLNYTPTLDSAFMDSPKADIPEEISKQIGDNPYMVLVPNMLTWHYAFKGRVTDEEMLNFWTDVVKSINREYPQTKLVMLPQTFNAAKEKDKDINLFHQIKQQMGNDNDRIIVAPETYSSDIQQQIIKEACLVIGARYHSVVFALNQATPFIALSYEHKIEGLLEALGKKECMIDLTNALDSAEKRILTTKKIMQMIPMAKPDTEARDQAKSITDKCLQQFINHIINR